MYRHTVRAKHRAFLSRHTAASARHLGFSLGLLFGLFFFALFVPYASPRGVWIGAIFGTLTAALVAFCGPIVLGLHLAFEVDPKTFGTILEKTLDEKTGVTTLSCPDPISFQWIAPLAVLVNIAVGCVASKLLPRSQPS